MKHLLFDTSAYSAFMVKRENIVKLAQEADKIAMTPVILAELLAGFIKGRKEKKNREILKLFLESPRVEILPIDSGTSERYAVILNSLWKARTPVPTNDIWIAASAMQYGFEIISMDKHFLKIPQVIVHTPE